MATVTRTGRQSGRKGRISKEIIQKVENAIRSGNYAKVAAQYAGISERTFYEWKATGERDIEKGDTTLYSQFFLSIKKAEAEAEVRNVSIIQAEAANTWQAAAWYLERKYKDRWSRREELTGKDGTPIASWSELMKQADAKKKNETKKD